MVKRILATALLTITSPAMARDLRVKINFSPESEKFAEATREYQTIWQAEGERIVAMMEQVSGLRFYETDIQAVVYEGVSYSGFLKTPMKMRASYPAEVKKATLIHELGHRLLAFVPSTKEVDNHRVLFLVLYDVWTKLYGKDFADRSVEVEKKRKGLYDYEAAWQWALSLSAEERAAKFKELAGKIQNQKK
ncbi:MAG: hypothetical protein ACREA2_07590 [Blastocatellia bacterium]